MYKIDHCSPLMVIPQSLQHQCCESSSSRYQNNVKKLKMILSHQLLEKRKEIRTTDVGFRQAQHLPVQPWTQQHAKDRQRLHLGRIDYNQTETTTRIDTKKNRDRCSVPSPTTPPPPKTRYPSQSFFPLFYRPLRVGPSYLTFILRPLDKDTP